MDSECLPSKQDIDNTVNFEPGYVAKNTYASKYIIKTLLYIVILGLAVLFLRSVLQEGIAFRNREAQLLYQSFCIIIICGIIYCLWIQYCIYAEKWLLISLFAFACIGLGWLLHTISLTMNDLSYSTEKHGFECFLLMQGIGGFILLYASQNEDIIDNSVMAHKRYGISKLISWSIIIAFILGILHITNNMWIYIKNDLPQPLSVLLTKFSVLLLSTHFLQTVMLIGAMGMLVLFANRHIKYEDSTSNYMVLFAAPVIIAQILLISIQSGYNADWWISQLLEIFALFVMLVGLMRQLGKTYESGYEKNNHLDFIHRVSHSFSADLDMKVVLFKLASESAETLSARFTSIMLADEKGQTLSTAVIYGLPVDEQDDVKKSAPHKVHGKGLPGFHSGHIARAFKERRICMVDDVFIDPEFLPWEILGRYYGYAVSIPLVYKDVDLGVLSLFFDSYIPINEERIRLLQTLGSTAAIAIANAQLQDRGLLTQDTISGSDMLFPNIYIA